MGTYITQTDVETQYGTNNVRMWSNLDNDTAAANTTNIAAAIAVAEEDVENRFRGGKWYAVPFVATGTSIPQIIKQWCSQLAGYQLYQGRINRGNAKDEYADRMAALDKEILAYVNGARRMACANAASVQPTSPTLITPVRSPYVNPSWGDTYNPQRDYRPC